jgi:hypothetical protein
VSAVGAAILDASGRPIAGLGISAPSARFTTRKIEQVAEIVVAAATRVSQRIGWTPSTLRAGNTAADGYQRRRADWSSV